MQAEKTKEVAAAQVELFVLTGRLLDLADEVRTQRDRLLTAVHGGDGTDDQEGHTDEQ